MSIDLVLILYIAIGGVISILSDTKSNRRIKMEFQDFVDAQICILFWPLILAVAIHTIIKRMRDE